MELLPSDFHDVTVLRRLIFASVYLPKDIPKYWSVIAWFVSHGSLKGKTLSPDSVKIAVENLQVINEKAFANDQALIQELHSLCPTPLSSLPLGIVLVSPISICPVCTGDLLIRNDRPSRITVYTESWGTVVGTHYHKICQQFRKGCTYRQYYGYSTVGTSVSTPTYDSDWEGLNYFISSSETAFELCMLRNFDGELLLGQISYSQKAEIYNYSKGYPVQPKRCTTLTKDEMPVRYVIGGLEKCECMSRIIFCVLFVRYH